MYEDSEEKIQTFLDRGSKDEAVRMAHTIKGVAANLGAMELSRSAAALESCFKENRVEVSKGLLANYGNQMQQLLIGLKKLDDLWMIWGQIFILDNSLKILSNLCFKIRDFFHFNTQPFSDKINSTAICERISS